MTAILIEAPPLPPVDDSAGGDDRGPRPEPPPHGLIARPASLEHLTEDEALIARAVSTPDLDVCGPLCDAECFCP